MSTPPPAPPPAPPRYVDLGTSAPKSSLWSNDPKDMQLDLYFYPDQTLVPGIQAAYNLGPLKPILVKKNDDDNDGSAIFLLTNEAHDAFWLWHEREGDMTRFRGAAGLTMDDVVGRVVADSFDGRDLYRQLRAAVVGQEEEKKKQKK